MAEFPADHARFEYSLGIDPGWKNLGMALVRRSFDTDEVQILKTWTINPSEHGLLGAVAMMESEVIAHLPSNVENLDYCAIERYVSYNNILTHEAENIVALIGALQYAFGSWGTKILLYRAIDWKVDMVKQLVKKYGFSNPSSKLDKKFSLAAAAACIRGNRKEESYVDVVFNNDHEADALCLASTPFLRSLAI